MVKETYEKFKKRISKEAQSKQNEVYKKLAQNVSKRISKDSKKVIKGVSKSVKYRPKLSSSLLNIGAGFAGGTQQRVKEGPGRPVGDYKHRSPFTGKPIPATQYYKEIKDYRRQQMQRANQVDQQAIQQLAKRGIPPEQAKQIIDQRQLQSVGVQQPMSDFQRLQMLQQMQQQNRPIPQQLPNTYPSQAVRPIWRRQSVVRKDWGLFGQKVVVQGNDPRSFWN